MYQHLQTHAAEIYAEMRQAAEEIGITADIANQIGLTGAISGCHGTLVRQAAEAMDRAAHQIIPSASLDDQIRQVVKEVYGDEYDAALVNTCEAALAVCTEVLFTPPQTGRGEPYRGRYLALYERFLEHHVSYGRPFPPKYKEFISERGETAGEYGVQGKRAANLDVVVVRPAGAAYPNHGIKYNPVPDLLHVNADQTLELAQKAGERHASSLVGFASLGYDTPGYGYGEKDASGTPLLQTGLAALAHRFDVPYVVDNAWGVPFIGADIRKLGCDVMLYSMDKVTGSPTSGLIIGKEEPMTALRRALGIHGTRYGTLSSHGKAVFASFDPGKEALVGTLAALRVLKDQPEITLKALDDLHRIVIDEFECLPDRLRQGWAIYKSTNALGVELNYSSTWEYGRLGIPIFSMEDMYAGSHLLQSGLTAMGIMPTVAFDANIVVSNGLGNLDEDGRLLENPTRMAVKGMFKAIEIVSRWGGYLQ